MFDFNLLVLIVIIIFAFIAVRYSNKLSRSRVASWREQSYFKDLARIMGLQYEIAPFDGDIQTNVIDDRFELIQGNYKGVPFKLTHEKKIEVTGVRTTRSMGRGVVLEIGVANRGGKRFVIQEKSKGGEVMENVAVSADFDKNLLLFGDKIFSDSFYKLCADYGWMNLRLEGNKLIFIDDFWHQIAVNGIEFLTRMKEVHPIYKSNIYMKKEEIDLFAYRDFIDKLVEEIKTAGLL